MQLKLNDNITQSVGAFHCPRYHEIPTIGLYKDQVISFIEDALQPLNISKTEKVLTPTMLNNYVKQKVVSPPKKRRYTEKHLAYLIVVCLLKQVYSLSEVCELIQLQTNTCSIERAYDYFCEELENALNAVFLTRNFSEINHEYKEKIESEILHSATIAFAHKLYIQAHLLELKGLKTIESAT